MASGPTAGGSVYNTSANAFNGAVGATQGAMGMNAMMPTAQAQTTAYNGFTGMNADGTPMNGFGAGVASGGGYTASMADGAQNVSAGQFAGTDLNPYLNPYQQQVTDQTQADMERARLIEMNGSNDAMMAAGAFGGSRHGIANAETNRGYYDRLGSTLSGLNQEGYLNAQNAAFQDINNTMTADLANQQSALSTNQFNAGAQNQASMTGANNATSASIANANGQTQLASQRFGAVNSANAANAGEANANSRFNADALNTGAQNRFGNQMAGASQLGGLSSLGFGMGNTIAAQQAADGALARTIPQSLMDNAQNQFAQYSGAGNIGLGNLQSGIASSASPTSTTSTQNPGLLGILGSLAGI